ncbi:MAG: hypothetical protein NUW37_09745 [Planctomycetes bacterium]|nr:hypothetical protein [Planctomycetota bacterium]
MTKLSAKDFESPDVPVGNVVCPLCLGQLYENDVRCRMCDAPLSEDAIRRLAPKAEKPKSLRWKFCAPCWAFWGIVTGSLIASGYSIERANGGEPDRYIQTIAEAPFQIAGLITGNDYLESLDVTSAKFFAVTIVFYTASVFLLGLILTKGICPTCLGRKK